MSRVPVIWLLLGGDRSVRNSAYRGEAAPSPVISLALQQALQSWDGFLDRLPIGIYACDRDGIVVQYNRRAAELWGRSLGEGRQRYCGSYKAYRAGGAPLPPSEAPMAQVLRTGLPMRDREIVIERPDGSRATILANVDPLFDGAGEIVGGVNCFQDITELKRSQEALREREQWYRGLLEALPAAVYTTDAGGRITFYNQAAVELAGRLPALGSQWCVTWRLHWPDGTPCRMRNAPWRCRSRNSGRCGAPRRWPSAPMARAFPSYPIRRRFTTAPARWSAR